MPVSNPHPAAVANTNGGSPTAAEGGANAVTTLYDGPPRGVVEFSAYFGWISFCLVFGLGGYFLARVEMFRGWPLWLLGALGLPGLLVTALRHRTTRYKLTSQRVEFERGIIGKTIDSVELWRVLDVRYSQSAWDRILGIGTITLVSTDQTHPRFDIRGLPHSRRVFEQLREAVQDRRLHRRPMELVDHDHAADFR